MKKAICMMALAAVTFGSVYAAPVIDGKNLTAASDTTKKKMKMKGDKKKMKMKSDTGMKSKPMKSKMKMKKDTMSTKM